MIALAPADRAKIDRLFALLSTHTQLRIKGMVRRIDKDGRIDLWLRRGPLLLRGSTALTNAYCLVPADAEPTIPADGSVPEEAVEVTGARGQWGQPVVLAGLEIAADVDLALAALVRQEEPERLEAARHEMWKWSNAHENVQPVWKTSIKIGRAKRAAAR